MKQVMMLMLLALAAAADGRTIEGNVTLAIRDIPPGARLIKAWIPIPRTDERQVLADCLVQGGMPATVLSDPARGNQMMVLELPGASGSAQTSVTLHFRVERLGTPRAHIAAGVDSDFRPFLARLMPPDRRLLEPDLSEREDSGTIRRIFQRLAGPDGSGLARGLSETDRAQALHTLFVDELTELGIQARLVSGLVLPEMNRPWTLFGPRYWAEYRLPGKAWIPVDLLDGQYEDGFENRITLATEGPAGRARPAGAGAPRVEIDGILHVSFEAVWSGQDVKREPVTLAFNAPAAGRRK